MTKILVVSDIHQDDRALDSLLKHGKDYEAIWFLGDVVGHEDHMDYKYDGYKGDSYACYEMLRYWQVDCIIGNWEYWLLHPEKDEDERANQHKYVRELRHARAALSKNGILPWIATWPLSLIFEPFTLVHGAIDSDGQENLQPCELYMFPHDLDLVERIFLYEKLSTPHLLFGHTHLPGYFTCNNHHMPEWTYIRDGELNQEIPYNIHNHLLHFVINPGSLSLNRDDQASGFQSGLIGTALEIDTKTQTFRYLPVTFE